MDNKTGPDQPGVTKHHREQRDDALDPWLIDELDLEPGEVDLRLVTRWRFKAHFEACRSGRPQLAYAIADDAVAADYGCEPASIILYRAGGNVVCYDSSYPGFEVRIRHRDVRQTEKDENQNEKTCGCRDTAPASHRRLLPLDYHLRATATLPCTGNPLLEAFTEETASAQRLDFDQVGESLIPSALPSR